MQTPVQRAIEAVLRYTLIIVGLTVLGMGIYGLLIVATTGASPTIKGMTGVATIIWVVSWLSVLVKLLLKK